MAHLHAKPSALAWAHAVATPLERLLNASDKLETTNARHVVISQAFPHLKRVPQPLMKLLPDMDVRNIPINIRCSDNCVKATLPAPWTWAFPPGIRTALTNLAIAHARATDSCDICGRVAVIRGTPCPQWHVDKVRLRGLCTLYGDGSVLLDDTAGAQEAEMFLQAGDVVLMRGAGEHGESPADAVTHRSPLIPENCGTPRVIVQTDNIPTP